MGDLGTSHMNELNDSILDHGDFMKKNLIYEKVII